MKKKSTVSNVNTRRRFECTADVISTTWHDDGLWTLNLTCLPGSAPGLVLFELIVNDSTYNEKKHN